MFDRDDGRCGASEGASVAPGGGGSGGGGGGGGGGAAKRGAASWRTIDRELGVPRLVLGSRGGVDVESADGPIASVALQPIPTVDAEQVGELVSRVGLRKDVAQALLPLLMALADGFAADTDKFWLEIDWLR